MKPDRPTPGVRVAALLVLAALAGYAAAVPERDDPKAVKEQVIFLGGGEVNGPGTVVQLDRRGAVLGTVALPATPYGLAVTPAGLVAALPGGKPGQVVTIDDRGRVATLLKDARAIPHPIAVAADPATGDVVVADNTTDLVYRLPGGRAPQSHTVLQLKPDPAHWQNMSVALAPDGTVVLGGGAPVGVFRFRPGKDAGLGPPVLPTDCPVAADPSSRRWAAAARGEVCVFDGDREALRLPYPPGAQKWHAPLAFGADGTLVLALQRGANHVDLVRLAPDGKALAPLFAHHGARVVSLAVGPRLAWPR